MIYWLLDPFLRIYPFKRGFSNGFNLNFIICFLCCILIIIFSFYSGFASIYFSAFLIVIYFSKSIKTFGFFFLAIKLLNIFDGFVQRYLISIFEISPQILDFVFGERVISILEGIDSIWNERGTRLAAGRFTALDVFDPLLAVYWRFAITV